MRVSFRLNGAPVSAEIVATASLVEVVRDLGHTGTKEGCGAGVCGVCTVLVDDRPVSACLFLAACAADADVWTVEGLRDRFPAVVAAFVTHEGMQCGICTPGQVVTACAAKLRGVPAREDAVREFLNGNLCRCTGYQTVVRSVLSVLDE